MTYICSLKLSLRNILPPPNSRRNSTGCYKQHQINQSKVFIKAAEEARLVPSVPFPTASPSGLTKHCCRELNRAQGCGLSHLSCNACSWGAIVRTSRMDWVRTTWTKVGFSVQRRRTANVQSQRKQKRWELISEEAGVVGGQISSIEVSVDWVWWFLRWEVKSSVFISVFGGSF